MVLAEGQRREILTTQGRGDVELVPIDQVLAGLGVTITSDAGGGAVTLTYQKREIALYKGKSLASVGGDLRLLSAPVVFDQGKWLVPVDALPRLVGPLLGIKADWRPQGRVLLLGGATIPRVTVSAFLTGEVARVVFEASEKVPFRIQQEQGRVTVAVPRDLIDVAVQQERLAGGIVEHIQFVGGRENVFSITLGSRFQQMKAFEQEQPPRLVLDFQARRPPPRERRLRPRDRPWPDGRGARPDGQRDRGVSARSSSIPATAARTWARRARAACSRRTSPSPSRGACARS